MARSLVALALLRSRRRLRSRKDEEKLSAMADSEVARGRRDVAMPADRSVVVVAAVAAALGIFNSWSTPQPAARRSLAQFVPFSELWDADRQFDDGDDQSNYANHPLLRARQNIVPKLNTIVRASWFHEPVIGVWEPITTMAKMMLVDAFGLHACVFVRASLCLHALNILLAGVLALGLIAYLLPETTNPIPHVVAVITGVITAESSPESSPGSSP